MILHSCVPYLNNKNGTSLYMYLSMIDIYNFTKDELYATPY